MPSRLSGGALLRITDDVLLAGGDAAPAGGDEAAATKMEG